MVKILLHLKTSHYHLHFIINYLNLPSCHNNNHKFINSFEYHYKMHNHIRIPKQIIQLFNLYFLKVLLIQELFILKVDLHKLLNYQIVIALVCFLVFNFLHLGFNLFIEAYEDRHLAILFDLFIHLNLISAKLFHYFHLFN